jgi:hypothetical protein
MVAPTCFGITLPSSGSVPGLYVRTTSLATTRPSIAPQLSISQKALGTLPEDGSVMPKHVEATIHN